MRFLGILALAFALLPRAEAQVTVEVLQERDEFLPGESVPVTVKIVNRSGRTLHLGEDEQWLNVMVEPRDSGVLARTGDISVKGPFELPSGKLAKKHLDISPAYALNNIGRYSVTATVHVNELDKDIRSSPRDFMVIEGSKLWEQDFGVPGTNGAPAQARKFILQQSRHDMRHLFLSLRVTDATSGHTFKVAPVGGLTSFSRVEAQVDSENNVHIIFQDGPQTSLYSVFNYRGELILRQTYLYAEVRPRLVRADGKVSVTGLRKAAVSDFPPPEEHAAAASPNPANSLDNK